ncbi:endonuclease/exonuclease/phosphatase family protein [Roseivirga pacifica]|uniref:endonuclease/exonuclease/phosphatase family protein n=1 Tax=Roseivirga pacifica TaxID=1267423 RepID=UPI0020954C5F|nr:endonuclease/exonuclease/phosphatase family protein [Roseivirga pacifica]MCO6359553.1 hypothetical protein [Roseivirga pacifica]MCO6366923.1 hypothetical protein [Roseivirga pacifica]MCO6370545.1 hypothetical protein [Roseivirga pacifica]MCO6374580.1 hypothetical protein [Roseivirga pacifica]MCO6379838.1 hypothetical protein [Roseivirga pacifica]
MPNYYDLLSESEIEKHGHPRFIERSLNKQEKKRAIKKILQIKESIVEQGIPKKQGDNLLVANWNLKEFGQTSKHPEFHYYIAEMMSAFDLIVVQEVRRSIRELQILVNILGQHWAYVINDVTEGSAGNSERGAIIYDKRRVDFNGFSGELVVVDGPQLKRTPHITGFISGWKHFSIINVHLDPGKKSENELHRYDELKRIMETMSPKLKTQGLGYENIILTGDFNFYPNIDDESVDLLAGYDFKQLTKLESVDTTLAKNNYTYDRVFIRRDKYFEIVKGEDGLEKGGTLEFRSLFEDDVETYRAMAREDYQRRNPSKTFNEANYPNYFWVHWLSRQMSDHYPIWFELKTDSATTYLNSAFSKL